MCLIRKCRKCHKEFSVNERHQAFIICDNCKPDAKTLYELFVVEGKTKKEISTLYGLTTKVIKSLLSKNKIKKRCNLFGYTRKICAECYYSFYTNNENIVCNICLNENKGIEEIDFVKCKICNVRKKSLVTHIVRLHKVSAKEYKERYNVQLLCKKVQNDINSKVSNTLRKQWEQGDYDHLFTWVREENIPEKEIDKISENIVYVGGNKKDHKRFWIRTSKLRNPDFVVIDDIEYCKKIKDKSWFEKQDIVAEDYLNKKIKIKKVIEHNGFYWHNRRFKEKNENKDLIIKQYEKDMIEDYKKANIECLVVWDFQLQNDKLNTYNLINNFVK
jgi:hypothetical protein